MMRAIGQLAAIVTIVGAGVVGCSSNAIPPIQPMDPVPSPTIAQALPAGCDHATIAGVDDLVTRQLEAFRARDFEGAWALSSAQFQAISSPADLQALIDDGEHPEVMDSVSHAIVDCQDIDPGTVSAAVSVTGANGRTIALAYQVVFEDGRWAILMSRPMGGHGQVVPEPKGSPTGSLSA